MTTRNWIGRRQGSLLVARRVGSRHDGQSLWECRCDCGATCIKSSGNLRQGVKSCSTSCGVSASNRKRAVHGAAHSKEWKAWAAAKQRCLNPNHPQYPNYGARGITMCAEWVCDFSTFYAHIGPAPSNDRRSTLERIDNDRGYEPNNVRWATQVEQLNNQRRSIVVEVSGKRMTSAEACELYGIPYTTISARWRKGLRGAALVAPRKRILKPKETDQ